MIIKSPLPLFPKIRMWLIHTYIYNTYIYNYVYRICIYVCIHVHLYTTCVYLLILDVVFRHIIVMMNIWLSRLHNSNSVSLQLFVNSQTPRLEVFGIWKEEKAAGSTHPRVISSSTVKMPLISRWALAITMARVGWRGRGLKWRRLSEDGRSFGVKACDSSSGSCSSCSRLVSKNAQMRLVNRI